MNSLAADSERRGRPRRATVGFVATVGERLATLEALERDNAQRLDELRELVNGGATVSWERSVRGRLHRIETTLAGLVLRRNFGVGLLKGWERAVLVACGVATAAASWYAALHHFSH